MSQAQSQVKEVPLDFQMRLAEIKRKLEVNEPGFGTLLNHIHKQIHSLPELSYILSEEDIGRIVESNKREMKIEISAKEKPEGQSLRSELKKGVSVDDF